MTSALSAKKVFREGFINKCTHGPRRRPRSHGSHRHPRSYGPHRSPRSYRSYRPGRGHHAGRGRGGHPVPGGGHRGGGRHDPERPAGEPAGRRLYRLSAQKALRQTPQGFHYTFISPDSPSAPGSACRWPRPWCPASAGPPPGLSPRAPP